MTYLDNYEDHALPRAAFKQALCDTLGAMSVDDALAEQAPDWLIPSLIQKRSIHVISADQQTCKTWLGLSCMHAGLTGTPVLGFQPTEYFDTLYLCADSPTWDVGGQLASIARGTGARIPEHTSSMVFPYGFNLLSPKHRAVLLDYCRNFGISLLVLDVLLYAYSGADENSNSEMAEVYRALKLLRDEADLAILVLHHWAKSGNTSRGAGTITQAAEQEYWLTRSAMGITLQRKKLRGESWWSELTFNLTPMNGGMVLVPGQPPVDPIVQVLSLAPDNSMSKLELLAWAEAQSLSGAWLGKHLTQRRKAGIITTDGKGNWRLA